MLERYKANTLRLVERQGKVGQNLNRLKIAREQMDKILKDTEEFNERILNPQEWNIKLRERQRAEIHELREMRDRNRIKMITSMKTDGRSGYQSQLDYRLE